MKSAKIITGVFSDELPLETKIKQAIQASKDHLEFIHANQDSCYDKSDIGRELGYQEALSLVEYWLKLRIYSREK